MKPLELDELVRQARRDRPVSGALASVAKRLGIPFSAVPLALLPSEAPSAVAPAAGLSLGATAGLGAGALVVVSGIVFGAWVRPPEPVVPATGVRAMPAMSSPLAAEAPSNEPTLAPEPTAAAASEPRSPRTEPLAGPSTWDEPQLIERARRALAGEPRRALSLAQEHQRRFPAGALAVEREVILIEALARSGQVKAAQNRALAFESKYPASIHLPRIRSLGSRLSRDK